MVGAVLALGGAAGRAMKARGHGVIINVGSVASLLPMGAYSAIKSWVATYSESLALELTGTGVVVTTLLPGWVRTEFHQRAGIRTDAIPWVLWLDADRVAEIACATPLGGDCDPCLRHATSLWRSSPNMRRVRWCAALPRRSEAAAHDAEPTHPERCPLPAALATAASVRRPTSGVAHNAGLVDPHHRRGIRQHRRLAPPFVVVANHCSHLDTVVIVSKLPYHAVRHLAVGAAADHFYTKRLNKLATSLSFNAYPIHRDRAGQRPAKGLSRRLLADGVPLLIYPEGTGRATDPSGTSVPERQRYAWKPVFPVFGGPARHWGRDAGGTLVAACGPAGRAHDDRDPDDPTPSDDAEAFNARVAAAVAALYRRPAMQLRFAVVPAIGVRAC